MLCGSPSWPAGWQGSVTHRPRPRESPAAFPNPVGQDGEAMNQLKRPHSCKRPVEVGSPAGARWLSQRPRAEDTWCCVQARGGVITLAAEPHKVIRGERRVARGHRGDPAAGQRLHRHRDPAR